MNIDIGFLCSLRIWLVSTFLCLAGISSGNAQDLSNSLVENQLENSANGKVELSIDAVSGQVVFLTIEDGVVRQPYNGRRTSDPETAAVQFLNQYGLLFGLTDSASAELEVKFTNEAVVPPLSNSQGALPQSRSSVKLQQRKSGVSVYGGEIIVRLDSSAQVTGANGRLSNGHTPSTRPRVSRAEAQLTALEVTAKTHPTASSMNLSITDSELMIYNPMLVGKGADREFLAWRFEITANDVPVRQIILINALNGRVLLSFNHIPEALDRTVHDQFNDDTQSIPSGFVIRTEGGAPTGDYDADRAFDYTGDYYNYFYNFHGRDSIDDFGYPLIGAVRFCEQGSVCPYGNALWNGNISLFGDGLVVDDAVAHEWAHGFTEFTSNLIYLNESGAINESLSDLWGEFVDLTYPSGPNGDDSASVRWLIAEDAPNGYVRSMSNPPAKFHPDKITSNIYYCGTFDDGGVHINSGVNNKAATLMVDGGSFNGYTINPIGIPKTSHIYYEAQTNHLTQSSTYNDLFNALNSSCSTLIGSHGIVAADCVDVENAVLAVEMNQANACVNPPSPPLCESGVVTNSFLDDFETNNFSTQWSLVDLVGVSGNWSRSMAYPFAGVANVLGDNPAVITDSYMVNQNAVIVPANAILAFEHLPDIEAGWDGGVVEISSDGGTNWQDIEPYFLHNPYTNFIGTASDSPLVGRNSFSGGGNYRRTMVDLSSFAGLNLLVRFRIGTSSSVGYQGWEIDDVRVYSCVEGGDPVASDDALTVAEGATATVLDGGVTSVLANDTDSDLPNDVLTATLDQDGAYGAATVNGDGTFSYVHNDSENFTDTFTYIVTDQDGGVSDTGVVTVAVTPVNDHDPVAVDETMTVLEGGTQTELTGAVLSVLANDTDIDLPNDTLTVAVDQNGVNGTVTLGADGTFSYVHDGSDTISDSFTYTLTDSNAGPTSTGTVTITITPVSAPSLIIPMAGTLTGPSELFEWSANGSQIDAWWLYVGSVVGGKQYFSSGAAMPSSHLSEQITGLPVDGSKVHVRLWFREGGNPWHFIDQSFDATGVAPELTKPAGEYLDGSTHQFMWADNGAVGATQWQIFAGSQVGLSDYYKGGLLNDVNSTVVADLPVDGVTIIYVRLWYRTGVGPWMFIDQDYVAASTAGNMPFISSPTDATALTGTAITYTWDDNGYGVSDWWLYLGFHVGGKQYFDSGITSTLSQSVTGLPSDGSEVYARLWYRTGNSGWLFVDSVNTAIGTLPMITQPVSGVLSGPTEAFSWIGNNGGSINNWWLYAGSTLGAKDLFDSAALGLSSSVVVTGLPTSGEPVFIRLWYKLVGDNNWKYIDREYTAFSP